ncbi:DNA alkylation repair protein [Carboxylicivirga sp. N1Y90]|uniref:DNA alkylation repair protein n=1 Tax=Carboxylicivirga fragile TaxID=3417571 RepID=UPI003D32B769|nr:DNA alkylation repair protein [Marinilabiliaceae bacterium N1Y90]
MAEPFKNLYSKQFFDVFTEALDDVLDDFNKEQFLNKIITSEWDDLELKQRMYHISEVLATYLTRDYPKSVDQLLQIIASLKTNKVEAKVKYPDLVFMLIPNYIENYGLHDFTTSVEAFQKITPFTTCEFAVRPFIIKYGDKMLMEMLRWAKHENHHVRRLASEGCRSRLPWGMALRDLKRDPNPILSILENLKNDSSEYVRKSVANNLNDISKDNPQVTIDIVKKWKGQTKETDWIVKHASRTLLKAGNQELMQLFGFGAIDDIEIRNFQVLRHEVRVGDALGFSFEIHNQSTKSELIRLEYAIYYLKKNGTHTKKVFKISEKEYAPNSITNITRRQSFKIVSTRKYHMGDHLISLIINGVEVDEGAFELKA